MHIFYWSAAVPIFYGLLFLKETHQYNVLLEITSRTAVNISVIETFLSSYSKYITNPKNIR